jgi:Kef-type K+ transport system membrane component KefB
LGLNLDINSLLKMLKKTTIVTLIVSSLLTAIICTITLFLGFSWSSSLMMGISLIFSSTIISLKLLPTTALHHQHIGNLVISILLLQDIIAIVVITALGAFMIESASAQYLQIFKVSIALPVLIVIGFGLQTFVLKHLLRRFNRFQEYIFLVAIGWCLGMSELGHWLGMPYEIGAFIAGIVLASSPIAQYIYENLKPLRDFFLVIFFFSVGASFDFIKASQFIVSIGVITMILLILKPIFFGGLLRLFKEDAKTSWEVGFRLGQGSEFSLLIAILANKVALLSHSGLLVTQAVTLLTFIISSYFVVVTLPNPLALSDKLRKD